MIRFMAVVISHSAIINVDTFGRRNMSQSIEATAWDLLQSVASEAFMVCFQSLLMDARLSSFGWPTNLNTLYATVSVDSSFHT